MSNILPYDTRSRTYVKPPGYDRALTKEVLILMDYYDKHGCLGKTMERMTRSQAYNVAVGIAKKIVKQQFETQMCKDEEKRQNSLAVF